MTAKEFGLGPVPYYHLGLSRAMTLLGVRTVRGRDWWVLGARAVVATQEEDGSWYRGERAETDVLETCFQLLFLRRATVPAR